MGRFLPRPHDAREIGPAQQESGAYDHYLPSHFKVREKLPQSILTNSPFPAVSSLATVEDGFVGCELSWILSPFLAKPGISVPFINPDAFRSNFFEYLWRTAMGYL